MKKELNLMITPAEFPVPLIILPETDSTNNYLTQLCNEQQSAVREFTHFSATIKNSLLDVKSFLPSSSL